MSVHLQFSISLLTFVDLHSFQSSDQLFFEFFSEIRESFSRLFSLLNLFHLYLNMASFTSYFIESVYLFSLPAASNFSQIPWSKKLHPKFYSQDLVALSEGPLSSSQFIVLLLGLPKERAALKTKLFYMSRQMATNTRRGEVNALARHWWLRAWKQERRNLREGCVL